MYSPGRDNSKPLGPAWGIIAGVALLLVGVGLVCVFVIGLASGETIKWAKIHRGVVAHEDSPWLFWVSEFFSLLFGVMLASIGVRILRDACRQLRQ